MEHHLEKSEKQNSNSSLKVIIAVLAISLVGSLVYMYKMSSDSAVVEKQLISEKDSVMGDLQKLKATYDIAIAEKTTLSEELVVEKNKVVQLIENLKKSKGDVVSLLKYKNDFKKLENKMKLLVAENDLLKEQNQQLTFERDSTIVELGQSKKYNDALVTQNKNLFKTVEIASALSILNLKVEAIKERSSGKQIITEKAKKANKLKICFTIAENKLAKSGDKSYYVQVIDSRNNIIGEKKTLAFEKEEDLKYSFLTVVKYQNKTTVVCEYIKAKATGDFEKGTYFVNVFDGKQMVSKTSFTLK